MHVQGKFKSHFIPSENLQFANYWIIDSQVFINFLPPYLGVLRPHPEESVQKEEPKEDPPIARVDYNLRPGGEYFIRKINPELIAPWRGR